jgi:hypothetical protein
MGPRIKPGDLGYYRSAGAEPIHNDAARGVCDVEPDHPHTIGKTCIRWRSSEEPRPLNPMAVVWVWLAVMMLFMTVLFGRGH